MADEIVRPDQCHRPGDRHGLCVISCDLPSIQFDIVSPFQFLQVSFDDKSWLNAYLGTFVVLHPQANPDEVIGKFIRIHELNAKSDKTVTYGLQRITDIHLNPQEISDQIREAGMC
ncbi:hypothetical protein [Dyadobacter sp. CY351]|uniref:hypothetical protein n=1 Tax=Dyadobacter sp. CY351 TaxID=2909337 RepID=UPI001F2E0FF5|nr:hypothetical protein [Dyadobacter sp. CY351]MCF2516744.1 hypothetical protein [Dyadobacter sp. CY351]